MNLEEDGGTQELIFPELKCRRRDGAGHRQDTGRDGIHGTHVHPQQEDTVTLSPSNE